LLIDTNSDKSKNVSFNGKNQIIKKLSYYRFLNCNKQKLYNQIPTGNSDYCLQRGG
jgi:hypothetical protein